MSENYSLTVTLAFVEMYGLQHWFIDLWISVAVYLPWNIVVHLILIH